nr:DUF1931 family protein [Microbispora sp. GKU 823]
MAEVMAVPRFERFFRTAAGLDVDKEDLRRYSDFVNQKLYDLLVIGQAHAKANVRGRRRDLGPAHHQGPPGEHPPVPRPRRGHRAEADPGAARGVASARPVHRRGGEGTAARDVGGLALALARTFTILDPGLKNPRTEQWERVIRVFELLL